MTTRAAHRKLDRLELKLQRTYANKDYLFREMIVRMHTRARTLARAHAQSACAPARAGGDEKIGHKRRHSLSAPGLAGLDA
jgi:hypothetical protein